MRDARAQVAACTLRYPNHVLSPEDLLHFVELDEFSKDWESLGLDVEDDLLALQVSIMCDPERGNVIQGTGGLRKMRFSPPGSNTGKSGAIRVCYAYIREHWLVLLVLAYGKSDKLDLSQRDKQGVKEYLDHVRKHLSERKYS